MEDKMVKSLRADPDYCVGCKGCEFACAREHDAVTNIMVTQQGDKKIPAYCRHCEEAFCMQLCPTKAITRESGVVSLTEEKCIGCGICEQGCPYGVITMKARKDHPKNEVAKKCDLCKDRQIKGSAPLCYEACPTKALALV